MFERKNQIVIEMARCMLFAMKLSKDFWAKVVSIVIYLLNILLPRVVERMT